jgi:uncharacterized protein (UPF0332 family)
MASIKWCLSQKQGLRVIEPNEVMSDSYLRMAEESITALNDLQSRMWKATATYYIFYYSLYSLMLRIGLKCEIHSCSLIFMKGFLSDFYSHEDNEMIQKAFSARIDLQYYADRQVDEQVIQQTSSYCKEFFIKTKDVLSRMTNEQISEIRGKMDDFS